jgi:hypothetical protein
MRGWEGTRTGSGSRPAAGFGISGDENPGSAITVLVSLLLLLLLLLLYFHLFFNVNPYCCFCAWL